MNKKSGFNINTKFSLEYQHLYLHLVFIQTSWQEKNNLKINGTLDLKTFREDFKHVDLTYEMKKEESDLKSSISVRHNSVEVINLYAEGLIQTNKFSLIVRLDYNFSGKKTVQATLEYRKKSNAVLVRSKLTTVGIEIVADIKFKFYPHQKFDLRIVSKNMSPASLRVYFENANMRKVLKTELKHQNVQIAGLNLQYGFHSIDDIKVITRGKYFLNAIEFDIIRTNTSNNLATNLFIENESIFLAKFASSIARVDNILKSTITGKLQSKYDLPKVDFIKEELCSGPLNTTRLSLFYNDLQANITLRYEAESEASFENLFLIKTNIDVLREGKVKLIVVKMDEKIQNVFQFKLNDKFFSVDTEYNTSPRSLTVQVSGPWSAVSLRATITKTTGGFLFTFRFQDNKGRVQKYLLC